MDLTKQKILITGGGGFVGKHLVAELVRRGCDVFAPDRRRYDLSQFQKADAALFEQDVVFHLAAKCGGIGANRANPADFLADNLQMGLNVIEAARRQGVKKLVMIGTMCSFPVGVDYIRPEDLFAGPPEITNRPYGIAKAALIEAGKAYHQQYGLNVVNVIPTNMYGPGDNFDPNSSHVIPALIRKFEEAKKSGDEIVEVWGTGSATRDFLYVADAVDGIIKAAECVDDPHPVLLGSGCEISMRQLAWDISRIVGYNGRILWDIEKPDGQPRRVVSTIGQQERLNFYPSKSLADGIRETVDWWRSVKGVCNQ